MLQSISIINEFMRFTVPVRCAMASSSFKIVSLGGGNASGYLARELVESSKLSRGELAIITDEPVSSRSVRRSAIYRIYRYRDGCAQASDISIPVLDALDPHDRYNWTH